jgi:hypothetical protein
MSSDQIGTKTAPKFAVGDHVFVKPLMIVTEIDRIVTRMLKSGDVAGYRLSHQGTNRAFSENELEPVGGSARRERVRTRTSKAPKASGNMVSGRRAAQGRRG